MAMSHRAPVILHPRRSVEIDRIIVSKPIGKSQIISATHVSA